MSQQRNLATSSWRRNATNDSKAMAPRRMSVNVGDWPKLPTKAERISTVTGSFRTLGLANFRWRPESVARTNGEGILRLVGGQKSAELN